MPVVDKVFAELKEAGIRVKVDDRDQVSPGFKFNDWEMRGVPLSDVSFWKQWLKVFPYAKGGMSEWPRSRTKFGLKRLVVIHSQQRMCADFYKFYGTASDEVLNAMEDWDEADKGM